MALTDNLISYWTLADNSSTQTDNHGSNDGTVANATYTASGKITGAHDFESSSASNKITIPNDATLNVTSAITIQAWVKFETVTGAVLDKGFDGSNLPYRLCNQSAATEKFGFYNGTWRNVNYSTFSTGVWYHIVMTYDGTTIRVYKDGTEVGTHSYSGSLPTNTKDLTIGVYDASGSFSDWFDGLICEVGIWSVALPATGTDSVETLYNSGSGLAYPFTTDITITPSALTLSTTATAPTYFVQVPPLSLGTNLNIPTPTLEGPEPPLNGTLEIGTGGRGTKFINTNWPKEERPEIIKEVVSLVPEKVKIIKKNRVGLDG
ncbi:MAG: LamG domain-containing protein [Candidatus Peribacteraceae bacterium]|nr:LamG domain-containing protein [Candidatus Peribacteraceae bacterium]